MDCIHSDDDSPQMYINPDECICCNACANECPVGAIFQDNDLPEKWAHYAQINADFYEGKPSPASLGKEGPGEVKTF